MKKPLVITVAFVFLPLLVGLTLAFWGPLQSHLGRSDSAVALHQGNTSLWKEALEAYSAGENARASELLKVDWATVLAEEDGCDLVVSVFAENKDFDLVEKAARACLKERKGMETASEALGFALSSQGRIPEAIKILEGLRDDAAPVRLHVTLARLHLMLAHDDLARREFLTAVKKADVWSMWVSYALKLPSFSEDKGFMSELLSILASKPKVLPDLEKQVLEVAQKLSVEPEVLKLAAKRLETSQSELNR